jgi:hypothetical protein
MVAHSNRGDKLLKTTLLRVVGGTQKSVRMQSPTATLHMEMMRHCSQQQQPNASLPLSDQTQVCIELHLVSAMTNLILNPMDAWLN